MTPHLIGRSQLCHLFTLAIATRRSTKEYKILLSNASVILAQFQEREHYIHFYPFQEEEFRVPNFSSSATFKEERVTLKTSDLQVDLIVGFVTCLYDKKWWLACVLLIIQEDSQVKLIFLHQHGPSSSYKYPET